MIRLKLMPDYYCHCLWSMDDPENIDPDSLPISSDLKVDLFRWEKAYDDTLNHQDPACSGFPNRCTEIIFDEQGRSLWMRLKKELPNYHVCYFSILSNSLFN